MPVPTSSPSEFAFELVLYTRLEQTTDWSPAHQLGASAALPGSRIIGVCVVVPGSGFGDHARITDRTISAAAIEGDVGAGSAVFWRDGFDYYPGRVRRTTDRAAEVGFFKSERHRSREYVRRAARHLDDWFVRFVGIENRPDLGGLGDLLRQSRPDVSLAVFDEVIFATGSYATGTHLSRIPEGVGVWRFDPDTGDREVAREPCPLSPDLTGVEPVEYHSLRTDVVFVSPAEKRTARLRPAERVYGKGWRAHDLLSYACVRVDADDRPVCDHSDHIVDPGSECGPDCPAFEAADPPGLDRDGLRESRMGWAVDPSSAVRRQSRLDRHR